jgi:hypothetical protein
VAANFISPAQLKGMSKGRRPAAGGGLGPSPVGAEPGSGPLQPTGDPVPAEVAPGLMSGLGHMGDWADKIHPVKDI